jgi:O-acetyl-ADP-ribose deacetylase (regulator of RNase III)
MIKEISGDLLFSKAQVIAHGVAPNDPFHSGLALQLREHSPAMYKDFRHYCQTRNPVGLDGSRRKTHRQPFYPGRN